MPIAPPPPIPNRIQRSAGGPIRTFGTHTPICEKSGGGHPITGASSRRESRPGHELIAQADEGDNRTATLLPDGIVLLAGGWDAGAGGTAELYHPKVLVPSPMVLSLSGDGRGPGRSCTREYIRWSPPATLPWLEKPVPSGVAPGSDVPVRFDLPQSPEQRSHHRPALSRSRQTLATFGR
jgi:hypothetical protein